MSNAKHAVRTTAEIARPAPEVFEHLAHPDRLYEWLPIEGDVEWLTDAPLRSGTRVRVSHARAGRMILQYRSVLPPNRWVVEGTGERLDLHIRGEVTPTRRGSHVALVLEVDAVKAIHPPNGVLRRRIRRDLDDALARLRDQLEGDAAA